MSKLALSLVPACPSRHRLSTMRRGARKRPFQTVGNPGLRC